ncbi:3-oxoacyl-ACP synthase [Jejudonia soesokkakensis]|uniref:3-oxoacyl-ACP synthase n=1 Tax=Jejudonia soesokkakensis TaxID=1323432 RepID=A0ABW2MUH4_9FLAO
MLKTNYYISNYCSIKNSEIQLNGTCVFSEDSKDLTRFLKHYYTSKQLSYPKFFKMDRLSKLAFTGSEIILEQLAEGKESTALVFSNKSASLDTDIKHQKSIEDPTTMFASPSIFVYTLPNIGMGEVSIRHKLHTENAFFVSSQLQEDLLHEYAESLLETENCKQVLCAWVEVFENSYHGFFYLVSKNGTIAHTPPMIKELYTT